MRRERLYTLIVAALTCTTMAWGQRYVAEDDIYYDPTQENPVVEQIREEREERTQHNYIASNSYSDNSSYSDREVDEYNRRYLPELDSIVNYQVEDQATYSINSQGEVEQGYYLNGFNGSERDYEYAERIRKFYNPSLAIHVSEPAYTTLYMANPMDWNVYVDNNYAWVTPTWSNPAYMDYNFSPSFGYTGWGYGWGSRPYYGYTGGYWGGGFGGYWGSGYNYGWGGGYNYGWGGYYPHYGCYDPYYGYYPHHRPPYHRPPHHHYPVVPRKEYAANGRNTVGGGRSTVSSSGRSTQSSSRSTGTSTSRSSVSRSRSTTPSTSRTTATTPNRTTTSTPRRTRTRISTTPTRSSNSNSSSSNHTTTTPSRYSRSSSSSSSSSSNSATYNRSSSSSSSSHSTSSSFGGSSSSSSRSGGGRGR